MESIGKYLVVAGAVIALVGVALIFFDKIPFLGKLPGDIYIKRENFQFYFFGYNGSSAKYFYQRYHLANFTIQKVMP